MTRFILPIIVLLLNLEPAWAGPPEKTDILSWPRMTAPAFGCLLEKTFAVRDPKFNCSMKDYVNDGDPCKKTQEYYEGPAFPEGQAQRLHPLVAEVDLSWEHGELQSVSLEFKKKVPRTELIKIFNLPQDFSNLAGHENVLSIDLQDCGKGENCLIVQGFDHIGAGESECGQQ